MYSQVSPLNSYEFEQKFISVDRLKELNNNKPITTFITDLDGTIVADNGTINSSVKLNYQKAKASGLNIIVATGRCFAGAEQVLQENDCENIKLYPGLYLNGGVVYDEKGHILHEAFVDTSLALKLLDYVESINQMVLGTEGWNKNPDVVDPPAEFGIPCVDSNSLPQSFIEIGFYSRHTITFRSETQLADGFRLYKDGLILYDRNISETLKHTKINKIVIFTYSASLMRKYYQDILDIVKDPAMITSGLLRSVEITPAGINKAVGLETLLEHYKLSKDECITIGDGYNDLEMLRDFPLSIAMGNAVDIDKSVAKFITHDVLEEGWQKAITQVLKYNEFCKK